MAQDEKKSFKFTLNLPKTDFPIRPNHDVDDALLIERWEQEGLFVKSFNLNKGKEVFILHDGPPYANGPIHLGHAYNKILKDIIGKSQRMQEKHVPITPGWDCHGLPIELKVTQELNGKEVTEKEFIQACRDYASKWIDIQKSQFKQLGVLMDWSDPYLTMNFGYEASILEAFGFFVNQGFIERKNKTIAWCSSCQTVLANAEIEYQERKDPSIYVLFPLHKFAIESLLPELKDRYVSLAIWTTTPWTLPLNRAVLVKPNTQYVVLKINNTFVIVGEQLAQKLCDQLEVPVVIVATFNSDALLALKTTAIHPFIAGLQVPLIGSDSVDTQEGTAFVHCAPGCGPEDYEIGVQHKLEIFSPISPSGLYTEGIQPEELVGMPVKDGQIWVIKQLAQQQALLFKTSIRHSYPHCWRCRQGLIFRATKQWFCDLAKHDLKQKTLQAISTITTYPTKASNRLLATLQGRLEWCLSRQRLWGVPIPALICSECDTVYTNKIFIDRVADYVAEQGVEYWNQATVDELVNKNVICVSCNGKSFYKETDIFDVWFDSGVSHYAVLCKRSALQFPANLYLEGKDQHRGWFQSSLLTSMVIEKEPAMKTVLTHGFTVDDKSRKMSKSLGNVISPDQIIKQLGTDGLRLWVSSIDYGDDAVVSPVLLKNVQEVFRKIRNTCRFLLSNLYDFDIDKDAVPINELYELDQYALQQIHEINSRIIQLYNEYDFTAVFHAFSDYCTIELSSFYLDIIKDRLYVEHPKKLQRRSAQTSCWHILNALTRLIAPILSFTAEQISDCYQKNKQESIHLQPFAFPPAVWGVTTQANMKIWEQLKRVRLALLKSIEQLREKGVIKHSLEVNLNIYLDPSDSDMKHLRFFLESLSYQTAEQFIKELMIISHVTLYSTNKALFPTEVKGLYVAVDRFEGTKCPRCWNWHRAEHVDGLCQRCQTVIY